jgi:hypothetical protein
MRQDRTGTQDPDQKQGGQATQPFGWRNVGVFLAMLLVNYLVVSQLFSASENPRVEIPYRADQRRHRRSRGRGGRLRRPDDRRRVRHPAGDAARPPDGGPLRHE